ncbi:hypothetical protein ACFL27_27900, partial [candidate division CSSED10-310 bacterium]
CIIRHNPVLMILPFAIPPFRCYSLSELLEVLLWQGMGLVGWPIVIIGGLFSFLFQAQSINPGALLLILIYPALLFLLIHVLSSKRPQWWALILMHILLTLSFAAVWFQVLNGYDFMVG